MIKIRTRNQNIAIRVTESEKEAIEKKAVKAKMSVTDYLIAAGVGKEISVIEDLKPILMELKHIGNNLNQLTTLSHMGRITEVSLEEMTEKLDGIYNEIYRIARENRSV